MLNSERRVDELTNEKENLETAHRDLVAEYNQIKAERD